jgi:hypothetical protein
MLTIPLEKTEMNNYQEQTRLMCPRVPRSGGANISITRTILLAFVAMVTLFPLTVIAQSRTVKLPDGFVNEKYEFNFAAAVKGEGDSQWTVDDPVKLPNGISLQVDGKLTGKPTKSGRYKFEVKSGDFKSTVLLKIMPAGFDMAQLR